MFQAPCPSCGASIEFRATTTVLAVCGYCRTTVVREADSVRGIGRMADLLEDYSPIQLGTTGTWERRAFTVIGRRQLRYDRGLWSEWYVLFADGSGGWLGDFCGQFVMTQESDPVADAPSFGSVKPGLTLLHSSVNYTAADIRQATVVSGAGELPFRIEPGQTCPVVDWRAGTRFLTLDWTAGKPPKVYAGAAVALDTLRPQFLRTPDEILQSAGRVRGAVRTLDCPNCGASVTAHAGVATNLVCTACRAELDASTDTATVLAVHRNVSGMSTRYVPGDSARIGQHTWRVIGVLRFREVGGDTSSLWNEYLLYAPARGFLWLVESDEGWERVTAVGDWPESTATEARWREQRFARAGQYQGEIVYAAGAFPWRARVRDTSMYTAYSAGKRTLILERSASELGWTVSDPVSTAELKSWFATGLDPSRPLVERKPLEMPPTTESELTGPAIIATLVLIAVNAPLFLADFSVSVFLVTVVAAALLWLPVFGLFTWEDG